MAEQGYRALTVAAAALTDAVAVVLFCTAGRRSHAEGLTVAGIAGTAWPFLVGALAGWLIARGWRRPLAVTPTGLVIWVVTVPVGMLLRAATGQGVAAAFWVVATLSTGVLLLGWRLAVALTSRRRGPGRTEPVVL
ncbi:DUF3054 domain-containing protein [Mycobacterium sp. 1274756.6]|uniref:DUF3054 domain-containing protein n=1 Tax=Mycobacterium sp. 1274756.6 TaxID=1834076 RepID=UPI0007FBF0F3|nr:DUF3054 domain-containing protein [Mycobacterium sp. 1274756.6]OBJ71256.1 hypothetical protein A5643_00790 [Mycobacterium sp. 1274756.6]